MTVCGHSPLRALRVLRGVGTRLAVSVGHDEGRRLVPPVEHEQQQQVPQLVAGAQVVELPCSTGRTLTHSLTHTCIHQSRRTSGGHSKVDIHHLYLTWEVAFRDFRNVEDEGQRCDDVHAENSG